MCFIRTENSLYTHDSVYFIIYCKFVEKLFNNIRYELLLYYYTRSVFRLISLTANFAHETLNCYYFRAHPRRSKRRVCVCVCARV